MNVYATNLVIKNIPTKIINQCISMLTGYYAEIINSDYMLIFNLTKLDSGIQVIEMVSSKPKYKTINYITNINKTIESTIWCILDGIGNFTFMFPEEY